MPFPIEHRPRCNVLVVPGLVRGAEPGQENQLPQQPVDLSSHLLRARTMKSLEGPNGTFELVFTFAGLDTASMPFGGVTIDRRALSEVLVPENMVQVAFDQGIPGSEITTVMQGTITKVFAKTTIDASGRPRREIIVTGEDWGKLLVEHDLPVHLFTTFIQGGREPVERALKKLSVIGAVGRVCEDLFTSVFRDQLGDIPTFTLGLRDLYAIDIEPELFDQARGYIYADGVWMRQGKFWNALRGLADEPWNELYADWDDLIRKFVIRLRRRPFEPDLWEALPVRTVTDDELLYVETTLTDHERVNWVLVVPSGLIHSTTDQSLDFLTFLVRRFDREDAEAHGARLLKRQSAFVDYPGGRNGATLLNDPEEQARLAGGSGRVFTNLDRRVRQLWDWFAINHRLRCGTWVCSGRPDIHIGERVANQREPSASFVNTEDARRTYYVEKVIHDYVEGHHFFTHLALTRGMPLDEFILPAVDGLAGREVAATAS